MIEAPAFGPVKFALQAVDFRPQGGIFGLFGQTLSGLVIFPEQVGFRAKTTGHHVEDGAFDTDGNFLVELGHPEIGQTLALSFVRLNLSGKNAKRVDLPSPFRPSRQIRSFLSIVMPTPSSRRGPPKDTVRLR